MELIFATNNQHKLEEVQQIVGPSFTLKRLQDIGCSDDIPETGNTFSANASQKSHYIYERYHCACFADDSGLEIDALNGEPGVDSAHYSGSRDAGQNMQLVLEKLGDNPNRKARFITVISLIIDGQEHFFEGIIEGHITNEPIGEQGFGYNPIFIPEGYERSFAQLDLQEKISINHRAKAIKKMIQFLNNYQLV